MKLSVYEMVELNKITRAAYKQGVSDESERILPNTLFDALVEYGKKTKTLLDYHKSSSDIDGCNWVNLKPTRAGSEGIKSVSIAFEANLTEINHIGIIED